MAKNNDDDTPGQVAERLFVKLVSQLASAGDVQAEAGRVLFFPNGIELISLTVGVGNFKVEIKVAGEKGLKSLELETAELEAAALAAGDAAM